MEVHRCRDMPESHMGGFSEKADVIMHETQEQSIPRFMETAKRLMGRDGNRVAKPRLVH